MSILMLIDQKLENEQGVADITTLDQYAPIVHAISLLKRNIFSIDHALSFDKKQSLSLAKYKEELDFARLLKKVSNYKVVVLMGERLCRFFLEKPMKDLVNKSTIINDQVFICTYSPTELLKKKLGCVQVFSLALNHFDGNILTKGLVPYEIVREVERLEEVIEYADVTKIVSFDFETNTLDYASDEAKATVLSLTFEPGYSYVIPFEHPEHLWQEGDFTRVLKLVHKLLTKEGVTKIAHNLTFDLHFLKLYGIGLSPRFADTMIMSHILDENVPNGLKKLCAHYFPFWDGYDDGVDYNGPLRQLSTYAAMDTNITLMLFYIFEEELLQDGNEKLYRLFRNLKMPALLALNKIEHLGAKMDRDRMIRSTAKAQDLLKKKETELDSYAEVQAYVKGKNKQLVNERIEEIDTIIAKLELQLEKKNEGIIDKHSVKIAKAKTAYSLEFTKEKPSEKKLQKLRILLDTRPELGGLNFYKKYDPLMSELVKLKTGQVLLYEKVNYSSPKQFAEVLYDVFKFPVPTVNREKKRTTDRQYISEFNHPFITTYSAYKTISKMLSTYYISMLEKLDKDDQIHTGFLLHGTKTHRLSSRGPNLQNIPARLNFKDEDAEWCLKEVKEFFIPLSDDYVMVQADYSQAELRVIANFAEEGNMQEAYLKDYDMHSYTGAAIADMTYDEFVATKGTAEFKEKRSAGKGANFSLLYGAGAQTVIASVYKDTGITWTDAQEAHVRKKFYGKYPKLKSYYRLQELRADKYKYVETLLGARRRFINLNSHIKSMVSKDYRNSINSPVQGTAGELTILAIALLHNRLPDSCKMWCTVHDSIFFYLRKDELHLLEVIKDTCENIPLDTYFGIKKESFPVPMKIDFEVSNKSWRSLEETTVENIYKQVSDMEST